jgi:hypothetical protein
VVGLDDASCPPDLHDVHEVYRPLVLLVGFVDDAYSLYVGCKTSGVDCAAEIFDEDFLLFGIGDVEFSGEEGAVEGFFDVDSVASVGGGDAEIVCC